MPFYTFLLSLVLMTGSSAAAVAGAWQGRQETVDGVTHVYNPASPSEGEITLDLNELWRIGGDSDRDGEFFGVIGDISVGSGGNIYLLDRQLTEIKIFTSDGVYVRTIGREGEGPGEFRRPSGMFLLPGGKVGVAQTRSDFITVLAPDGTPLEPINLFEGIEGRRMVFGAGQAGPNFMLTVMHQRMGDGKMDMVTQIAAFDTTGLELGTYHQVERHIDFSRPVINEAENARPVWSADGEGNVDIVSEYGVYAVHRFAKDGTPMRVVHREYESLPRTDDEKDEMRSRFMIRGPISPEITVAENHPDIQTVHTALDGSLWVLSSRGARPDSDGLLSSWDVFDPSGRYTHRVVLRGEGDVLGDGLVFRGDRLYVIRGQVSGMRSMWGRGSEAEDDYADPMAVICYQIPVF